MNNFKKDKYMVLKKVVDPKIASFLTESDLTKAKSMGLISTSIGITKFVRIIA